MYHCTFCARLPTPLHVYYHAPYTCSPSISTGRSSPVFGRLDFLSNQVAFLPWFASDTCKGYHFQTTSVSSVEVEQLLWIVSTPPEVTVALLLSCESPLRPNKALLSLKKLGPCARTRTRTAQVVQKASLSLTTSPTRSSPTGSRPSRERKIGRKGALCIHGRQGKSRLGDHLLQCHLWGLHLSRFQGTVARSELSKVLSQVSHDHVTISG